MKVILVNGSPRREGCTYTALNEVARTLGEAGIETEFFWIGAKPVGGCVACNGCAKLKKCVFDDAVNRFVELAEGADGFVIGSPVYYAGINGSLKGFLDRAFYSAGNRDVNPFRLKPAAAVVSARRAGTTVALDEIQKYFFIQEMPVVASRYWNMVHGSTPDQVREDAEGMQVMRVLGRNLAWIIRLREAGERAGVQPPEREAAVYTNFIR